MPGSFHPVSLTGDSSLRLQRVLKRELEEISFPEGDLKNQRINEPMNSGINMKHNAHPTLS